jgi:DNA-binding response OmpR family regulator
MRILLVEDNEILNRNIAKQLLRDGFEVDSCYDGEEALYYIEQNIHDVILLDRMLPHLSGTEVLSRTRKSGIITPIILITALDSLKDKIEGLDLGADDYLVKPIEYQELAARIRCISRRPANLTLSSEKEIADILWNPNENKLIGNKATTYLSKRESSLLDYFLAYMGQTLSRNLIITKVWGYENDVEDGNLDNYIYFLRKKLTQVGSGIKIITVRGVGYHMDGPATSIEFEN